MPKPIIATGNKNFINELILPGPKNLCAKNAVPNIPSTIPQTFGLPENCLTNISSADSGVTPDLIICAVRHASNAANSHIPTNPTTNIGAPPDMIAS